MACAYLGCPALSESGVLSFQGGLWGVVYIYICIGIRVSWLVGNKGIYSIGVILPYSGKGRILKPL